MRLLLLVNGPGELYSWGVPLVRYLKSKGWKIYLKLLPCQFSSGFEKVIALGEGMEFENGDEVDVILQLGGDAFWGWVEKRRRKVALLRYGFGVGGLFSFAYDLHLLPHAKLKESFNGARSVVVGSLSSDRVKGFPSREEARRLLGIGNGDFLLGIFPGSRLPIWRRASSFLMELTRFLPKGVVFRIGRSPFIPDEEPPFLPEASPELLLAGSDLLLTLPGTNILEAAALGTPMLVVAPISFFDLVPVEGMLGILSSIPLVGKGIRFLMLRSILRRGDFLSWPNKLYGGMLVPEMVGDISPRDVADRISRLIEDGEALREMRKSLPQVVGGPGASWRIEEVLKRSLTS